MIQIKETLCNLLGSTCKICTLCYKEIYLGYVNTGDEIYLDSQLNKLQLREILSYVLGGAQFLDIMTTDRLCNQCTHLAIQSYKFIKMCKENSEIVNIALQGLIGCLDGVTHNDKAVFFAITANNTANRVVHSKQKIEDLQSALSKINDAFIQPLCDLDQMVDEIEWDSGKDSLDLDKSTPKLIVKKKLKKELCTIVIKDDKQRLKCNLCSATFIKFRGAAQHYHKHHVPEPDHNHRFKKSICNIVMVENGIQKYECKNCLKLFPGYKWLVQHYMKTHVDEICYTKADIKTEEDDAYLAFTSMGTKNESDTEKYQCKSCCIMFNDIASAHSHYAQCHEQNDRSSEKRKRNFKVDERKFTVILKNGIRMYKCNVCQRAYSKYPSLQRHYSSTHCTRTRPEFGTGNSLICTVCGKKSKNQHCLKIHEALHTGERISCPKCKKNYKTKKTLKDHVCNPDHKRAPPPKVLTCDICKKMYSSKASIRGHILYQHMSPGYICTYCGKRCSRPEKLQNHLTVHTKERIFQCNVCQKRIASKESLNIHMRLHTGERPYPCLHCEQRFVSASRRYEHVMRDHQEVPGFECDICHKRFTRKQSLLEHKKKHDPKFAKKRYYDKDL